MSSKSKLLEDLSQEDYEEFQKFFESRQNKSKSTIETQNENTQQLEQLLRKVIMDKQQEGDFNQTQSNQNQTQFQSKFQTDPRDILNTQEVIILDKNSINSINNSVSGGLGSGLGLAKRPGLPISTSSSTFIGGNEVDSKSQVKRERISVVNIDSRDRDTTLYPFSNSFEIFLERSFQNVKRVDLLTTEFPNADQAIKTTPETLRNNKVHWVNQSNVSQQYSVDITPGNYTASTLTDEIVRKMNQVVNTDLSKNHFFDVDINLDTSIVDIRQLDLKPLKNNPVYVIENNNVITISQLNAPVEVGDTVFLSGVRGFIGGISPDEFNGYHTVTSTTANNGPILITDLNNIIDFTETSVSSTPKTAVIEKTLYNTPSELATAVETALDQAGTENYTVSFSANKYTINSTSTFTLDFSSGGNSSISAGEVLGFDTSSDTTNATSTVSDVDIPVSSFQFEIDTQAVFTSRGGSNGIKTGTLVPFMFLFGSNTDTVSNVLGYPDEDTSNNITTMTLSTFAGLITSASILSGPPRSINITSINHGLLTGDTVRLIDFITNPPIASNNDITSGQLSNVFVIEKVDNDNFKVPFSNISTINSSAGTPRWQSTKIAVYHPSHGLNTDDIIRIYRAPNTLGGVPSKHINNIPFTITVVDTNNYYFSLKNSFAQTSATSNSTTLRISARNTSLGTTLYGFNGIQDNTSDDGTTLNKQVNLGGEDYIFLTSPQLSNFNNSSQLVENIFAKILLTGVPGTRLYNTFASNPKTFDNTPLTVLSRLKFELRRQDNILFDLLNLDYSITLRIIEVIDEATNTNFNTRRGLREVIDASSI